MRNVHAVEYLGEMWSGSEVTGKSSPIKAGKLARDSSFFEDAFEEETVSHA